MTIIETGDVTTLQLDTVKTRKAHDFLKVTNEFSRNSTIARELSGLIDMMDEAANE